MTSGVRIQFLLMLGVCTSSTISQMIWSPCVMRKLTVQVADLQGAAAHPVWSHGHSGLRGHLRDIQRCEAPLLSRVLGVRKSLHGRTWATLVPPLSQAIGIRQGGVAAAQLHHTSNMAIADCGGQPGLQPYQLCPLTAARLQVSPCIHLRDVTRHPCHVAKTSLRSSQDSDIGMAASCLARLHATSAELSA